MFLFNLRQIFGENTRLSLSLHSYLLHVSQIMMIKFPSLSQQNIVHFIVFYATVYMKNRKHS